MEPTEFRKVVDPEVLGPEAFGPESSGPEASYSRNFQGRAFKSVPFKTLRLNGPLAILGLVALPIGLILMFTLGILILVGMFATSLLGSFGIGVTRGMKLTRTKSKR